MGINPSRSLSMNASCHAIKIAAITEDNRHKRMS